MDQPVVESLSIEQAAEAMDGLFDESPILGKNTDEAEAEPQGEVEATDEMEAGALEGEPDESEENVLEAEPEGEAEEQEPIETLAELSEALEIPIEEMMANLKTTVRVNGEDIPVTLKEAFDGYQKDADYRQKTSDLATQRRAFDEQTAQARQQLEAEYLQVGQLMQALEQSITPALDTAEMEALKAQDPSAYLIAKQEHAERLEQFRQIRQAAADQFALNQQALGQQQLAERQKIMERALEELPVRVPGWNAETKTAIDNYLTDEAYGYTLEELAQVVDPRLIELANKARLYDEQARQADIAKKKIKALPKVQKPGKSVSAGKKDNLRSARDRLRRTGRVEDAAALINID